MDSEKRDEIDLVELLEILISNKAKMLSAAVISASLAFFILKFTPVTYEGTLPLYGLNSSHMSGFFDINQAFNPAMPNKDEQLLENPNKLLTSEGFLEDFVSEFNSRTVLRMVLREQDPNILSLDSEAEKAALIIAKAQNMEITSAPSGATTNESLQFQINVRTGDRQLSKRILNETIERVNASIKQQTSDGIEHLKQGIGRDLKFKAKTLENKIDTLEYSQKLATQNRITFLSEQALIARKMNLAKHNNGSLPNPPKRIEGPNENNISINFNNGQPEYLRGYIAIEQEAKILRQQLKSGDILRNAPEYISLVSKIRNAQTDTQIERIDAAVEASPLAEGRNFRAVNIELDNLTFKKTRNDNLLVTVSALLGGLLGAIFVLIQYFLKLRKGDEQTA